MTSDPARLALYNRLGEVLGAEHADTMMRSLPVEPAHQLATRSDVDRLEGKIDDLGRALRDHQRTYVVTVVGAMTALTAIFGLVGLVT